VSVLGHSGFGLDNSGALVVSYLHPELLDRSSYSESCANRTSNLSRKPTSMQIRSLGRSLVLLGLVLHRTICLISSNSRYGRRQFQRDNR